MATKPRATIKRTFFAASLTCCGFHVALAVVVVGQLKPSGQEQILYILFESRPVQCINLTNINSYKQR